MSEVMEWYAADRDTRTFSCTCGWKGHLSDMGQELFSELVEHDCPECFASLVIREFPTLADVRRAAKRGDPEAIRRLPDYEQTASRAKRAKSSELKHADQLPELELAGPTRFVWDLEERDGERWTVVRVAGSGTEAWSEMAYYEGWPRAVAIRDLLAARYGDAFAGLVRTVRSGIWITGDDFRAVDLPLADEDDAPWLADTNPGWEAR